MTHLHTRTSFTYIVCPYVHGMSLHTLYCDIVGFGYKAQCALLLHSVCGCVCGLVRVCVERLVEMVCDFMKWCAVRYFTGEV